MVNMLIAGENVLEVKDLVNEVVSRNKNIRIARLSTDIEETVNVLNSEETEIDVALIDWKIQKSKGNNILNLLTKNKKQQYKDSIMIISEDFKQIQGIIGNELVYDYIIKGTNNNEIMYKVNRMVENKDIEEKRKQIIKELQYIGYNIEYIGTNYLIEAILQIYINKDKSKDNLQRDVYPVISEMYKKTAHNIKCNINRATECMYYECDNRRLQEYFGFYDDTKPTTKTVIFTVLNKIY